MKVQLTMLELVEKFGELCRKKYYVVKKFNFELCFSYIIFEGTKLFQLW
jgi:hypothetical protein